MYSGERPIGAANSKQTSTIASCHPPPPSLDPPPSPQFLEWEKIKSAKAQISSSHFWYTNFWVPDHLPPLPPTHNTNLHPLSFPILFELVKKSNFEQEQQKEPKASVFFVCVSDVKGSGVLPIEVQPGLIWRIQMHSSTLILISPSPSPRSPKKRNANWNGQPIGLEVDRAGGGGGGVWGVGVGGCMGC